MSIPKQQNSYPLRLPPDLRAQIEAEAAANKRTLHKEIVALLEEALEKRSPGYKPDLSSITWGELVKLLRTEAKKHGGSIKITIE
jgi:hypothetical protein